MAGLWRHFRLALGGRCGYLFALIPLLLHSLILRGRSQIGQTFYEGLDLVFIARLPQSEDQMVSGLLVFRVNLECRARLLNS